MHDDMASAFAFPPAARPADTVELALRTPDGAPWRLTFSAGIERFIGAYPRLPGLAGEDGLLRFRAAAGA